MSTLRCRLLLRTCVFLYAVATLPSVVGTVNSAWNCQDSSGAFTHEVNATCNMTDEVVVSGALTIEGLHGAHSQLVAADENRHFLVDSKTSTLALKWLNLTSGAPDEHGGSIKITKGARLNVSHCIFYKNTATSSTQSTSGGAIFAQGAIVSVDHTSFEKNHAEYMGGGVFINDFGSINLEASMFALNTADSGGGGITLKLGSTGNLRNSTFYRNEAMSRGGAIYVWGDTENAVALNLSRVRLVENKQTSTVQDKDLGGGGLGLKGNVNVDIRECTFLRNEAGSGSLNEKHGHQIMTHKIAEGAVGNVVVVTRCSKTSCPTIISTDIYTTVIGLKKPG